MDIVDAAAAWLGTHANELLEPATRNAGKAFGHLAKLPTTWIDAKAAEMKADSEARIQITKATTKAITKSIEVDPALAAIAAETTGLRIIREQRNALKVLKYAADDLAATGAAAESGEAAEISDDWLNAFEREAVDMSSERMQSLFGKILAGEIRRPRSYSIRTLRLMAQLDNRAAELFQRFCSLTCTLAIGPTILDSRVIAPGKPAAQNGLQDHGLSYSELNILSEYGLISTEYASQMPYGLAVLQTDKPYAPFCYANRYYFLMSDGAVNPDTFNAPGIGLSTAGQELLSIVEKTELPHYTVELSGFFKRCGFTLAQALPV